MGVGVLRNERAYPRSRAPSCSPGRSLAGAPVSLCTMRVHRRVRRNATITGQPRRRSYLRQLLLGLVQETGQELPAPLRKVEPEAVPTRQHSSRPRRHGVCSASVESPRGVAANLVAARPGHQLAARQQRPSSRPARLTSRLRTRRMPTPSCGVAAPASTSLCRRTALRGEARAASDGGR
jgi:hypothetical protein